MKNFDQFLKAVREDNEFFIDFGRIEDNKVTRADVGGFLSQAKAQKRRSNPISPNQADYVNWVLYDEISFAASAVVPQLTKLFVIPIGGSSKTKVNTNLEQVSTLAAPQWFNTTGISVYFYPNTAPIDLDNFLATEYLEFWVGGQKIYVEGPLDVFPSSGGLYNQSALGTMGAAATSYNTNTTNGWPSIGNMYDLRLPAGLQLGTNNGANVTADGIIGVTILQSQTFNVQLKADGGGATMAAVGAVPFAGVGLTVSVRLHGILSRGVY